MAEIDVIKNKAKELSRYYGRQKQVNSWSDAELREVGNLLVEFMQNSDGISFAGFLSQFSISLANANRLCDKYPEFAELYRQAKAIQEDRILDRSFDKTGDGSFGKFVLANRHEGWKDKTETTINLNVSSFNSVLSSVAASQSRLPIQSQLIDTQCIEDQSTPLTNTIDVDNQTLTINFEGVHADGVGPRMNVSDEEKISPPPL